MTPLFPSAVLAGVWYLLLGATAPGYTQETRKPNNAIADIPVARDIDTWIDLSGTVKGLARRLAER